jgi:hypothetical protein
MLKRRAFEASQHVSCLGLSSQQKGLAIGALAHLVGGSAKHLPSLLVAGGIETLSAKIALEVVATCKAL